MKRNARRMLPILRYSVPRLSVVTAVFLLQGTGVKAVCDIRASYLCYWDVATKFGLKPFTVVPDNKADYLTDFCSTPDDFPPKNMCEHLYSGCNQEEKIQFLTMEKGYTSLQNLTSNPKRCTSVGKFRDCVDFEAMGNCSGAEDTFPNENLEELKSKKKWLAVQLWFCVEHGLRRCSVNLVYHGSRIIYLFGIANAVIELNTPYYSEIPTAVSPSAIAKSTTVPTVVRKRSSFSGGYSLYASWVTYGRVVAFTG